MLPPRPLIVKGSDNPNTPTLDRSPLQGILPDTLPGGLAAGSRVVPKWRRLDQFDPKSKEYTLFLNSLLENEADRKATTSLEGEDAALVLEILAKALERGRNQGNLPGHVLRVLRNLAYNAGQVPNRYRIDRNLEFKIDHEVFASGGFSDVRRGTLGGQLVAVKTLRVAQNTNVVELQKHFCKETILWKNIAHPNVLGLTAVNIDRFTGQCSMVSELMVNGNIFTFIQRNSVNRLRLLADVAEGLQYLHDRKIFHGDIKGSNILVTNATPPRACLSDFGFSTPAQTNSFLISTRGINLGGGTPPYMAPELMYPSKFNLHNPHLSREVDIYAFGMSIYEVVTGVRPFVAEGMRKEELMFVVIEGGRPAKPANAEAIGFGNGVWDLMEKCWSQDRTQRPGTWDVRLRLRVAASLSSDAPPGPRIEIPLTRNISTCSTTSNAFSKLFNEQDQNAPTDPEGEIGESGHQYSRMIPLDHPMVEHSIILAGHIVGGIQTSVLPTVRRGFGMLERLPIPRFIADFRARFNLRFHRNSRLRQG